MMESPMNNNTTSRDAEIPSRFRGEMLRQIYRVWLFRKLLPVLAVEIVVLALVVYELGQAVFVQRVVENGMRVFFADPPKVFSFFIFAFMSTTFFIKILIVGMALVFALLVRHITQGILRLILVKENYFSQVRK